MPAKLHLIRDFLTGKMKVCEFALTNCCSSKCSFCSIWKQQPKVMVDKEKAFEAIEKLDKLGVRFVTLTGGDPLLHKDVIEIIKKCKKHNIITALLNADARLVSEETARKLAEAKLDFISISVDHYTKRIIEDSRKIENLKEYIENAVRLLKKYKLKTSASILICDYNHKELKELFDYCLDIGFDELALNYPEFSESPVYKLGGSAISLSKEDVVKALEKCIELKKQGYPIINPIDSMRDIMRFLKNKKTKYLCTGGRYVFFVDWLFDVYPCMHHAKPMGNLFELKKEDFKDLKCNACNMSWYRDFSIYFRNVHSIWPVIHELKQIIKIKI